MSGTSSWTLQGDDQGDGNSATSTLSVPPSGSHTTSGIDRQGNGLAGGQDSGLPDGQGNGSSAAKTEPFGYRTDGNVPGSDVTGGCDTGSIIMEYSPYNSTPSPYNKPEMSRMRIARAFKADSPNRSDSSGIAVPIKSQEGAAVRGNPAGDLPIGSYVVDVANTSIDSLKASSKDSPKDIISMTRALSNSDTVMKRGKTNVTPEIPIHFYLIPFLSGVFASFQAGMIALIGRVYDPVFSLWVNMVFGWMLWEISLHILKIDPLVFKERPVEKREPFAYWKCIGGGGLGSIAIFLMSLTVPEIGFVKFFVGITVGQISGSLLIDRTGFAGMVKRKLCVTQKILALVFVGCGVGMVAGGYSANENESASSATDTTISESPSSTNSISSEGTTSSSDPNGAAEVLFCILAFVCGVAFPCQASVNGAASRTAPYPTYGVLCSFRSAAATSTIILLATRIYYMELQPENGYQSSNNADSDGDVESSKFSDFFQLSNPAEVEGVNDSDNGYNGHPPFYFFLSGAIGKIHVFVVMFISQKIGVTPAFLLVLLGQLAGSLPLDVTGGFGLGMEKRPITLLKALGVLCTTVGVLCNMMVKDDRESTDERPG